MTPPKIPIGLNTIYRRRPVQLEILALLHRCPLTVQELAIMLPQSARNLKLALQRLISKGEIVPTPSGKYEIRSKK